jgi:DNA-binding transcriptional ArsR family regulator
VHGSFSALADDTRRRIVEVLAEGDRSVGELASLFSISRPGVSRHLRVLRDAGLVSAEVAAQRRIYRLRPEPLAELDVWLGRCLRFSRERHSPAELRHR